MTADHQMHDSMKKSLDQGLSWAHVAAWPSLRDLTLPEVNIQAIAARPDAIAYVAQLPAPVIIYSILKNGLEDSVEVLPLLTDEQATFLFDATGWSDDAENSGLVRSEMFKALQAFGQVSPEEAYRRFRSLEEEVQVSLLQPFIRVFDQDEFEKLGDMQQDQLRIMPCGTVYYAIDSGDPLAVQVIESLVNTAQGQDLNWSYSLLAHSAYAIPLEQEELAQQFRNARMSEEGFIPKTEALAIFRSHTRAESTALELVQAEDVALSSRLAKTGAPPFLDQVLSRLRSQDVRMMEIRDVFLRLVNTVASALDVDFTESHALTDVLRHVKSVVGVGLEYAAHGDVDLGVKILSKDHPQTLFRLGLAVADKVRVIVLDALQQAGVSEAKEIESLWRLGKIGEALLIIDVKLLEKCGFENSEMLKGLFNRFPLVPQETKALDDGARRVEFVPVQSLSQWQLFLAGTATHAWTELDSLATGSVGHKSSTQGAGAWPV